MLLYSQLSTLCATFSAVFSMTFIELAIEVVSPGTGNLELSIHFSIFVLISVTSLSTKVDSSASVRVVATLI